MSSTRCILLVFMILILSAFILSYFKDVIHVDIDRSPSSHKRSASAPFPDDQFDRIFWFIQITDIHISKFYDKERTNQLRKFCNNYLDTLKPDLVLVTGDLTDAKHANTQGSEQFLEEWVTYWNILQESNALKKTLWLDVRGNHDSFNIPYIDHKDNYYNQYSNQGRKHKTSYHYIHKKPYGQYSFIAADACPDPGPKRPFNFFGVLSEPRLKVLQGFRQRASSSNTTIWMGHYPSSLIVTPEPGFRDLISSGSAYLCGHLHTLGGVMPQMFTMHKEGNLELELGDWRDNRIYRVMAIDHDLLSFIDVTFGQWPIILVTNPKNAAFVVPHHEPTGRMLRSSFIRTLVWSDSEIEKVDISINGQHHGQARHVKGPLYVLEWNPSMFSEGLHALSVTALDVNGKKQTVDQQFSLDNTDVGFRLLPRVLLMSDVSFVVKYVFVAVWLLAVVPLILFRVLGKISVPMQYSGSLVRFVKTVLNRTHLIANTNCLFYPLVLHAVYLAVGPWFIGYVLDDYIGVCFVYGIYVKGQILPMYITYVVGIVQLLTFNIPLTHYLGYCLDYRLTRVEKDHVVGKNLFTTCLLSFHYHWAFYLIIGFETFLAVHGFYLAYGTIAFLIGPVRTWSVFFALYLRWKVMRVTKDLHGQSVTNGTAESCR
ncbi:transmembrane protein 62-like isoform X2 [Lineus longissimus]|uniref:transmembrane protein 62-like isoform X2 n=1 Tax=Lineus longissimus TaxID=88925 RepID=UPI002B4FB524